MQLLATFAPPEYAAWKAAFDAHAEARDQAGLTLLQLWRHADAPDTATALLEVADRPRAEAWLRTENALRGPVAGTFLRIA
ncbi:MAG: hypothetical protein N2422_08755 [Rhodobacteraceae bacterium]|nr:hypothetical protein [Paracoccaceae bacterium]